MMNTLHSYLQDVQHIDIDTMDERKSFTVDPLYFQNLGLLVDDIKERGMRTMSISVSILLAHCILWIVDNEIVKKTICLMTQ